MKSRKETHSRKKSPIYMKFLGGAIFLLIIVGSSIGIAFANPDVSALLSSWFNKQTDSSIQEIDTAINKELAIQKSRLKEELGLIIESKEKEMGEFTESEKQRGVSALRSYADQLINNFEIDPSVDHERYIADLNKIIDQAIHQMNQVKSKKQKENKPANQEPVNKEEKQPAEQETKENVKEETPEPSQSEPETNETAPEESEQDAVDAKEAPVQVEEAEEETKENETK